MAPSRPIGFWLKLVDRLIDERFDEMLREQALTRRHWQVLSLLRQAPRTLPEVDAQVAPFLGSGEESTRPVLADLRARGWVSGDDGPVGPLTLTRAGAAAHDGLLEKVSASRRQVTAGISPGEYQATVEVLHRMASNLGWTEADPS